MEPALINIFLGGTERKIFIKARAVRQGDAPRAFSALGAAPWCSAEKTKPMRLREHAATRTEGRIAACGGAPARGAGRAQPPNQLQ